MNREEETTARVTRGALRRRSVDLDTSTGNSTPKKIPTGKKLAILDSIQEGANGSVDYSSEDVSNTTRSTRARKDTPSVTSKTSQKKREEDKSGRRSRAASLTEENLASLDASLEVRRTPRRRPSQDVISTPQTEPQSSRRVTRRNSATSEDVPLSVTTPTVQKSRLSLAPPTIAEDDEKEDKINTSHEDADLSDLDIRKLRNRSISNSPVQRSITPSGKNTSINSQNTDDYLQSKQEIANGSSDKLPSPLKIETDDGKGQEVSVTECSNNEVSIQNTSSTLQTSLKNKSIGNDDAVTPVKDSSTKHQETMTTGKNVTFDEQSSLRLQIHSSYPKTPIVTGDRKSIRIYENRTNSEDNQEIPKSMSEMFEIDETDTESPTKVDTTRKVESKIDPNSPPVTQNPAEELDTSMDASLANIVDNVKENLNRADLSMSILETPRKTEKQKTHLSRLREGSSSTPVCATLVEEECVTNLSQNTIEVQVPTETNKPSTPKDTSISAKSWSHVVKRSSEIGIDAFRVRKQEEQNRQDEESRQLNESLKRKSLEIARIDHEEDDDEESKNSLVDDEAMEVDDYHSGDSLDSETRADMEQNDIPVDGESIGSQDSEMSEDADRDGDEEEQDEKDSFIVSDDEGSNLLEGTGDDLALGEEPVRRRRIIQQVDSSDYEDQEIEKEISETTEAPNNVSIAGVSSSTDDSKDATAEESKSPNKSPQKISSRSPENVKSPSFKKSVNTEELLRHRDEAPKSRKSLPAPVMISADFYTSSLKKAKRNTINPMAPEVADIEKSSKEETKQNPWMVSNPAAMTLAKKNKRFSLEPTTSVVKSDKRASLPGKLSQHKGLCSPLKQNGTHVSNEPEPLIEEKTLPVEATEPMEVSGSAEEANKIPTKNIEVTKKKPKEISEFDHDMILSRCNEIVRADKEKKKQNASLRQKKKDEKRRLREQQKLDESAEGNDESTEQQKKKKKKKKQINYLLEELGETKEQQLARAIQRKVALLEAKRERKKAKKAAKLLQQLNKENQNNQPKEGIGAKFEKNAKKKKEKKKANLIEAVENISSVPIVKSNLSAFAVYGAQIEELKKEQTLGKKKKQLKEKNQTSATEEVQEALQANVQSKIKKAETDSGDKTTRLDTSDENGSNSKTKEKSAKKKKTDKLEHSDNEKIQKKTTDHFTKTPLETTKEPKQSKGSKLKQTGSAPSDSLDETLIKLKQSLSEPITKVVKKQKLSQKESVIVRQFSEVEVTPPRKITGGARKLKALTRLESGFMEEPMTPEHQMLKRNHGFREEPVTPKPIGFRVSNILPAGQEELRVQANAARKNRKRVNPHFRRTAQVLEPVRTLPLPIWTRSGTFEVEEVSIQDHKKKSSKTPDSNYVPLNVNGSGSGKISTQFLLKPLTSTKTKEKGLGKARRVELSDVEQDVINFKKQAIHVKNAHLREKKSKY
ncbi:protein slender lobes [Malaya genurostris]|uniref:protein slender lobes n=1 Tax=Malaya genurostris TaxID=325434 RepID=UPI0026F3A6A2|nr:protein slender lobes [Malaya genurostris]